MLAIRNHDGNVQVFDGPVLTEEEALQEEERVAKAALADKRFAQITDRRLLRFSTVFKRGKAAADMPQRSFNFSDSAKDQVAVAKSWIECDAGGYVAGPRNNGRKRLRPMELSEADQVEAEKTCKCPICASRRKFACFVD
ncbi:hypothetical protein VE02_06489 [Pseudogymnoascus sp. 03VT05]|nr:hypothetical protein VE02_06489 [Pseudogymnoascus sp. 03VT05]